MFRQTDKQQWSYGLTCWYVSTGENNQGANSKNNNFESHDTSKRNHKSSKVKLWKKKRCWKRSRLNVDWMSTVIVSFRQLFLSRCWHSISVLNALSFDGSAILQWPSKQNTWPFCWEKIIRLSVNGIKYRLKRFLGMTFKEKIKLPTYMLLNVNLLYYN